MAVPRRRKPPSRPARPPGLDFTSAMRTLCEDMVTRVPQLGHIDLRRVALSYCQTRKSVSHGLYACLTPMRFAGGRREVTRGGRKWAVQQLHDEAGREILYILSFYLPRFLDLPFREKLNTVVHELWHISPRFDGDLRRFGGRCYAHSGSQKNYDAQVQRLVDRWLSSDPAPSVYEFLRESFRGLVRRHGQVYGLKVPSPKLYPIE